MLNITLTKTTATITTQTTPSSMDALWPSVVHHIKSVLIIEATNR